MNGHNPHTFLKYEAMPDRDLRADWEEAGFFMQQYV